MVDDAYRDHLADLLAPLGDVALRRMFGGLGLFRDGLMFGLVADGDLHFKVDDETLPAFEAEDCRPFSYGTRDGRRTITSYWRAPDRLFDEPDEFLAWAERAIAAARRVAAGSPKGRAKGRRVRSEE